MIPVRIYKMGIHFGEEPIIVGNHRSGMINFSGCHLACSFCYTPETSVRKEGRDYPVQSLAQVFDELAQQGAQNLNLISPTHFFPQLEAPLRDCRLPKVLKVSGYESVALARRFAHCADVVVPDFKVLSETAAAKVNLPRNYGVVATAMIETLESQYRKPQFTPDGKLARGVVVRHLMMPGFFEDSLAVVERLAEISFSGMLNVMTRFVSPAEHRLVCPKAADLIRLVQLAQGYGLTLLVNGKPGALAKAPERTVAHVG